MNNSEIFTEQAEYLSVKAFTDWSTSVHNEAIIIRKLSQSGAKLITGPRGCGKTTLLLKVYNNLIQNIDFLDLNTAKAFENIQDIAAKKDYVFSIKTSFDKTNELKLDKTTRYHRTEAIWADAEFYFYGKVTNAGGKDKANIHVFTEELGTVRIQTPISFLEQYDENLLYKTFGIRATGKQHSETGEIDTSTLKFIDLIDYQPKYDEVYLKQLRDKAKTSWLGNINSENWLREIRGGYDA